MSEKRKTKRSSVKHASLIPRYNSRIRQEYLDLDYVDKLDNKAENCKLPDGRMVTELEYMSLFMKEWNNAGVGAQSKAEDNAFHRTAKDVKECTDRNNHRNNDEFGVARARNLLYRLNPKALENYIEETENQVHYNYVEDAMIELLDSEKETEED